jgi:hypothetical protein
MNYKHLNVSALTQSLQLCTCCGVPTYQSVSGGALCDQCQAYESLHAALSSTLPAISSEHLP